MLKSRTILQAINLWGQKVKAGKLLVNRRSRNYFKLKNLMLKSSKHRLLNWIQGLMVRKHKTRWHHSTPPANRAFEREPQKKQQLETIKQKTWTGFQSNIL